MEDTGEATMGKTGEMSLMWRANSTYHRACPAGVPRSGKDGAGHIPHHNGLPRRANHARGIQVADVPGRAVKQEVGRKHVAQNDQCRAVTARIETWINRQTGYPGDPLGNT